MDGLSLPDMVSDLDILPPVPGRIIERGKRVSGMTRSVRGLGGHNTLLHRTNVGVSHSMLSGEVQLYYMGSKNKRSVLL